MLNGGEAVAETEVWLYRIFCALAASADRVNGADERVVWKEEQPYPLCLLSGMCVFQRHGRVQSINLRLEDRHAPQLSISDHGALCNFTTLQAGGDEFFERIKEICPNERAPVRHVYFTLFSSNGLAVYTTALQCRKKKPKLISVWRDQRETARLRFTNAPLHHIGYPGRPPLEHSRVEQPSTSLVAVVA